MNHPRRRPPAPVTPSSIRRPRLAPPPALATLGALGLLACQQPSPGAPGHGAGPAVIEKHVAAATLSGFTDSAVISGRTNPIAVRFAADGKVFIAEEAGRIWFYDSLTDPTPTLFADIRAKVNSYWDRGMLGFTLDPNYPASPYIYVLYSHDTATNPENGQSVADRNGVDDCPSPPGGTSAGCVTYGRLARITDDGNYPETNETTLLEEWGQQFPSHSIGTLMFGPDGKLYASGGDGASFGTQDYGQFGLPKNPLGDPPAGVGGTMTSPTARGGSLRSQSLRRPSGEDVRLNGSVVRLDPATAAAASGNPNASHPDPDARRILAFGLRNPYRFTIHPTTGDIWIGDVGDNTWEELDRIPAPVTSTTLNFGWPCYEGTPKHPAWDGLNIDMCEALYTQAASDPSKYTKPYWSYRHDQAAFAGDTCTPGSSGSATSGVTFYQGGNYPSTYGNALFLADHSRNCIWVMKAGAGGLPDTATVQTFISNAAHPSDLQIGPNGDLFYTDYEGGQLHRVRYQAPTAVASANPSSGNTPLTVSFTGSASLPGLTGDTLGYAWDLDGDGQFDDSTEADPSHVYTVTGTYTVKLRVTDQRGGSDDSDPLTINVGTTSTPPVPIMDTPGDGLTWIVNDTISFSGHATDFEDGDLPDSALFWEVVINHCPAAGCHEHLLQTFEGVAGGSFAAPDHDYPTYLTIRLTATDSDGAHTTVSRRIDPRTVDVTFLATPGTSPGLQLGWDTEVEETPFTRTMIIGSAATVNALNQSVGGAGYSFLSWSDGGAQDHTIVAGETNATYTANFQPSPWSSQDIGAVGAAGSWSESGGTFTVTGAGADIYGTADAFRFVYRPITGDATITARVTSVQLTQNYAKAGVMFRNSLDPGSRNAHALASPVPSSLLRYIVRTTDGGTSSTQTGPSSDLPAWVRLVRAGDVFTAYSSTDGTTWTQMGTPKTIAMNQTVYVGLAVTSHVAGTPCTATFDNVSIVTPPPPAPTGLVASGADGHVDLAWSAASNATSYTVKRATTSGGPYGALQANLGGTSFTDADVSNGTTYYYVVSASNTAGQSPDSSQASATPGVAVWSHLDVGTTGASGSYTEAGGTFTVEGAGADIWGSADAFQYVFQNVTGDATITARVTSIENVNTWSKAGVMMRETTAAGSTNVYALVSPTSTHLYRLQTRPTTGSASTSTAGGSGAIPVWLRVTRSGNDFTAYSSSNGTSWTQLGATTTIAMSSSITVGLAVTSHTAGTLAAGVFDSASITFPGPVQPPPAPTGLAAAPGDGQVGLSWNAASGATSYTVKRGTNAGGPYGTVQAGISGTSFTSTGLTNGTTYHFVVSASNAGGEGPDSTETSATPVVIWSSQDIGAVSATGSWSQAGGSYALTGSGADIWTGADEFRYVFQNISGNATITARVATIQNVDAFTKAGIMMRDGLAAGAVNVAMVTTPTPANEYRLQRRTTVGGTTAKTTSSGFGTGTAPIWLRLVRSGNNFSGFLSTNGTSWTQLGATLNVPMSTTIAVGLALTSHSDGNLATATFDGVSITTP